MDEAVWAPTVFTKNRDRVLTDAIAGRFFQRVRRAGAAVHVGRAFHGRRHAHRGVGESEEFSAEGRPAGDGDGRNFHGQTRTNETHASTTDPDAKLYRKTSNGEARLSYLGHLLVENRHGLIVDAMATVADGTAERDAAMLMLHARWRRDPRRRTVGADKAYDTHGLVEVLRALDVTPHVAQNLKRRGGSAIDARTTRHAGYAKSLHARPRVEPAFGWLKTIAWIRKVKLRGPREGRLALSLRERRLQSSPARHADGGAGMRTTATRPRAGDGRIDTRTEGRVPHRRRPTSRRSTSIPRFSATPSPHTDLEHPLNSSGRSASDSCCRVDEQEDSCLTGLRAKPPFICTNTIGATVGHSEPGETTEKEHCQRSMKLRAGQQAGCPGHPLRSCPSTVLIPYRRHARQSLPRQTPKRLTHEQSVRHCRPSRRSQSLPAI